MALKLLFISHQEFVRICEKIYLKVEQVLLFAPKRICAMLSARSYRRYNNEYIKIIVLNNLAMYCLTLLFTKPKLGNIFLIYIL